MAWSYTHQAVHFLSHNFLSDSRSDKKFKDKKQFQIYLTASERFGKTQFLRGKWQV